MSDEKDSTPVPVGGGGATTQGWHKIESFLRCPKEYQLSQVRGIVRPESTTPDYFAIGILVHAMRARWFGSRFSTTPETWESMVKAAHDEMEKAKLPIRPEAERLAMRYMQEYVGHWAVRPKPTPVAAEYLLGPSALVVGDPLSLYRTARLDDVSRYPELGNQLYIGEAKTDGKSVDNCLEQYTLHGQPMLQVLLWKMAPQGEATHGPVAGVMLDIIVKGRDGGRSKFARMPIQVTDHSLEWYTKSMRGYLTAASRVDWNSEVPRNVSACTRAAGAASHIPCMYRDLCKFGRSAAGQYVLPGGNSLVRWTPTETETTPPWE